MARKYGWSEYLKWSTTSWVLSSRSQGIEMAEDVQKSVVVKQSRVVLPILTTNVYEPRL